MIILFKTIRRKTRLLLDKLLLYFGYELNRLHNNNDLRITKEPLEIIYTQKDTVFEVDIKKCYNRFHFSYSLNGWHPFVKTVCEYIDNPSISYEKTTLYDFYEKYQPSSIFEACFNSNDYEFKFNNNLDKISSKFALCLPWSDEGANIEYWIPGHGYQFFGPVSQVKGEHEFERLVSVYESIKNIGYRPGNKYGEIDGYFLKMGNEYRFIIETGKHRLAVLSALGQDTVRVCFHKNWPRVIDIRDLKDWPQVKNGTWCEESAEIFFMQFFTDNGLAKAKTLGLKTL